MKRAREKSNGLATASKQLPNWFHVTSREIRLSEDEVRHEPIGTMVVLTLPITAWATHTREWGQFAPTLQGQAAHAAVTFILCALSNASWLGDVDLRVHPPAESLSHTLDTSVVRMAGANGALSPEELQQYSRLAKFFVYAERIPKRGDHSDVDTAGIRLFFISTDGSIDFPEVCEAWLALQRNGAAQQMFYKTHFKEMREHLDGDEESEDEEEEEDPMDEDYAEEDEKEEGEGSSARKRKASPKKKAKKRGRPSLKSKENGRFYVPIRRTPAISAEEFPEDECLRVQSISEFTETLILPYLLHVIGIPPQDVRQPESSSDNDTLYFGTLPRPEESNFKYMPQFAFGEAGAFAEPLVAKLRPEVQDPRYLDPNQYRETHQVGGVREHWHVFPFPENVFCYRIGKITPRSFLRSPFPWHTDPLAARLKELVEMVPTSRRQYIKNCIKDAIKATEHPMPETRTVEISDLNYVHIVVDALLALRNVHEPGYMVLAALTRMITHEKMGLRKNVFAIPMQKLQELWTLYSATAFSRFSRILNENKDLSLATRYALDCTQSNPLYSRPGEIVDCERHPYYHDFDPWCAHQMYFLANFERNLDVVSGAHTVRMLLWGAATVYLPPPTLVVNPVYFSKAGSGKSYLSGILRMFIPADSLDKPEYGIGSRGMASQSTRQTAMTMTIPTNECFNIVFQEEQNLAASTRDDKLSGAQREQQNMIKTGQTENQLHFQELSFVKMTINGVEKRVRVKHESSRMWRVCTVANTNISEVTEAVASRQLMILRPSIDRAMRNIRQRHAHPMEPLEQLNMSAFCKLQKQIWLNMFWLGMSSIAHCNPPPNIEVGKYVLLKMLEYLDRTPYVDFFQVRLIEMVTSCLGSATLWHAAHRLLTWEKSPIIEHDQRGNPVFPRFDWDHMIKARPLLFATESLAIDVICSFFANQMDFPFHAMLRAGARSCCDYSSVPIDDPFKMIMKSPQPSPSNQNVARAIAMITKKHLDINIMETEVGMYDPNYIEIEGRLEDVAIKVCNASHSLPQAYDHEQFLKKLLELVNKAAMTVIVLPPVRGPEMGEPRIGSSEGDASVVHYILKKYQNIGTPQFASHLKRERLPVLKRVPRRGHAGMGAALGILREFLLLKPEEALIKAVENLQYAHTRERSVMLGFPVMKNFQSKDIVIPHVLRCIRMKKNPRRPTFKVANPRYHPEELTDFVDDSYVRKNMQLIEIEEGERGESATTEEGEPSVFATNNESVSAGGMFPAASSTCKTLEFKEAYENELYRNFLQMIGKEPDDPEMSQYYPAAVPLGEGQEPQYPSKLVEAELETVEAFHHHLAEMQP